MTFAQIKIEALKLMFTSYEDDLKAPDLASKLYDPNYKSYLVNMNGSINRCLADIERRCILTPKVRTMGSTELQHGKFHPSFLLSWISDFYEVSSVVREDANGMISECTYRREGDTLILTDYKEDAEYRLLYHRRLEAITDEDDSKEVDLPSAIATAIPYFVKGDLYREDDAAEATQARNWYEMALASVETHSMGKQTHVRSVFSQV